MKGKEREKKIRKMFVLNPWESEDCYHDYHYRKEVLDGNLFINRQKHPWLQMEGN